MPPPLATPVVTQPTDDSPAVAGDEDVIEKEWVDKAKKIIQETKDDPYTRTTRVNELQKDYLKKRYNKDLGAST
jgi:Txe/YoeB family toxin of Txe-Axe toxin-antitoxin module